MKLKALMGAAVITGTLLSGVMTSVASAAPEPSGWDDVNDAVKGGGSDTTYNFMQRTEVLYNQAVGCDTDNAKPTVTPNNLGKCLTGAAQKQTDTAGNWDHDYLVNLYPTGSSAGVGALQLGDIDFARSSRGPASGEAALNFWAFGKDAIAVVTFGNRATGNLTLAQLKDIYECNITDWSQLGYAPGTIEPVGMNSSSGTYGTFNTLVGTTANNGSCVKRVGGPSGIFPFENDVKPIIDDPLINENNAIWWMSWAEWRSFSYKRGSAAVWSINGTAISPASVNNSTYPMTRFVYHVTKDPIAPGTAGDVTGPDTGAQGAVREFTEFLCKPEAGHTQNNFTGATNYRELTDIYSATGFLRVPASQRNAGLCRMETL